jgi:hypothetical protein
VKQTRHDGVQLTCLRGSVKRARCAGYRDDQDGRLAGGTPKWYHTLGRQTKFLRKY